MPTIHRRPRWSVSELEVTPEAAFIGRRTLLKAMGAGAIAGSALPILQAAAAEDGSAAGRTADLYPAGRNDTYKVERAITPEDITGIYNNFYEFGSHKQIWRAAQSLVTDPWAITIDGMVEKPITLGFDELVRRMKLEERAYRHRCVEAWSMTVPWTGFPLASLLAFARPLGSAQYVVFETFNDPGMASGQKQVWYPWPYTEGVTMAEAGNELAFLVTGVYGKPLPKQFGAPLRLALPWKYGFKSIKSIRRISFTDKRPQSFWEKIAPSEYGFWANVNPDVPHPRWSQAQEQVLDTGERIPTLLYNGYAEEVASLYASLQDEMLYR
ncbi:protein-methionine-sulfoxide reductase catalytic subunit MsrP [Nitratireductor indicus]|uniref:protein-methionine-sulfoxide reductase catalytic subunit MsrP n=1 Tax=Nitratireductor indicus TaxID=721133 RepID=UPI002874072E|nr:protein-methionine-sulfoxide reductase catalytic subunit MsrP [Nitratireductor indicus]MDS1135841.1 protein-methionine-sulfoxide reductase catalytic subunit MsrP [Nitratireductor indicus]